MKLITQLVLSLCMMVIVLQASAQDLPHTKRAASLMQQSNIDGAKEAIDLALTTDEELSPYTWYIHSYVYKELYKKYDSESKGIEYRETAVSSALQSLDLDKEEKYKAQVLKSVQYLASTYQNDAIDLSESQDIVEIEKALDYYDLYVKTQRINNAQVDFDTMKKDVYKQMAQSYQNLYLKDKKLVKHLQKANSYYQEALAIDEKDYDSNYNLAINYYNRGVQRISSINYQTPIHELMLIQEDCVALFKESLPYMLEAHDQTQQREEPLKGLMAIYMALSQEEKSNEYRSKLEEVTDK